MTIEDQPTRRYNRPINVHGAKRNSAALRPPCLNKIGAEESNGEHEAADNQSHQHVVDEHRYMSQALGTGPQIKPGVLSQATYAAALTVWMSLDDVHDLTK
jgi:hypothetical protein